MHPPHRSLSHILQSPGMHEEKIPEFFHGDVKFTGNLPVFENPLCIMAFTNRCGSNLLGEYLRQTQKIGGFYESLNHDTVQATSDNSSFKSFPEYIMGIFDRFSVDKQFGIKASLDQLLMLSRWNVLGMFPAVNVVHIRRLDVVSQAVSHWIAHQTKRWTSMQKETDIEPIYDYMRIDKVVLDTNFSNSTIPIVARALNMNYLDVVYEDLTRDPKGVLTSIGDSISLDLSDWHPKNPKLSRQANDINQEFAERYILELSSVMKPI